MSTLTELSETRASKVKHALSDWREAVLQVNSLLTWDQDWYPAVTAGIVSTFYLFVWYWDPTLITFLAFTGLFMTVADYLGPKIISQVYGQNSWTALKEKEYDLVCENVVSGYDKVEAMWTLCREARSRKPVFHFVATLVTLFSLAWLGNRVNNFFLAYVLTNSILMLPGLHKKGILQQYGAQLTLKIADVVKGKDHFKKVE